MPNKHVAPRERACRTQNRAVTARYTATTNLNFVIEVAAAANPTSWKGHGTQLRETRQPGVYRHRNLHNMKQTEYTKYFHAISVFAVT